MNKKIKVIELINKVYANLDVPQKVEYRSGIYEYKEECQDFYCYKSQDYLFSNIGLAVDKWLNTEVEILEDEDEEEIDIKDIDIIRDYRTSDDDLYNDNFGDFKSTINDLVKAVKQLDKNKVDYIQPYKED